MEGTSDIYLSAATRIIKLMASDPAAGDDTCISERLAVDLLYPLLSKHHKVVEIMQPATYWYKKVDIDDDGWVGIGELAAHFKKCSVRCKNEFFS